MKPIKILASLLLVTALAGIFLPSAGSAAPPGGPLYTLYPPLNFTGTGIECVSYLTWQRPMMPDSTTPPGLVGYYIYRDGDMVHYIHSGDTLFYYDYDLGWGTFNYAITANYDLTPYGLPGQFGESAQEQYLLNLNCGCCLPFYEPWDQGTFSFQSWMFTPTQSNWKLNTGQGNPAPAAFFTGTPAVQNYNVTLKSKPLPGMSWICANMYFTFDYKINDISQGGTEKLIPEYRLDTTWYPLQEILNQGSTDWVHKVFDISQVCGKKFWIRFRVTGQNSANIENWQIDNIYVYPVCKGPTNSQAARNGRMVNLSWGAPACDSLQVVTGYNVYRTDQTGDPPYTKLNTGILPGFSCTDTIPLSITNGVFRYYITVLQKNPDDYTLLCEASGDTLTVNYSLGVNETEATGVRLYPQPAYDRLSVQSDSPIGKFDLYTLAGQQVYTLSPVSRNKLSIPLSGLPAGIYMARIKTASGEYVRKVTIGQ